MIASQKVVNSLKPVLFLLLVVPACLSSCTNEPAAAELVGQMVGTDECDAPCFDGQSLRGATMDQVQEVLAASSFTQDADLNLEYDEGMIDEIWWYWPDDMAERLASGERHVFTLDGEYNEIFTRNHLVWTMYVTFAISLEELLDIFGPPIAITPYHSTRAGSEIFALIYQDPPGHFLAWTLCDDPELLANTDVRSYTYIDTHRDIAETNLNDYYFEPILPWDGYTDELPDCTVFRP